MTALDDITPLQRARMKAAAKALATGRHSIPLACHYCGSSSLYQDADSGLARYYSCAACGRETAHVAAQHDRRQKIRRFIADGIDIWREK